MEGKGGYHASIVLAREEVVHVRAGLALAFAGWMAFGAGVQYRLWPLFGGISHAQ